MGITAKLDTLESLNPSRLDILRDGKPWGPYNVTEEEVDELIDIFRRRESGTIKPDYTDEVADIYGRWTLCDYDAQIYEPIHAGCRAEDDFRAYCKEHYSRWMSADMIDYIAGIGAEIAHDWDEEETK